ncbi:MAG: hypothetical protein COB93_07725 [Sneathiella sp.]|nr:MAG: hypothetical protein COB93_07725 [Sneathiella sp.]
MQRSETEAILNQYYVAMKSANEAAFKEVVTDDIVIEYHDSTGVLPWSGTYSGFAGFQQFLATVRENLVIDHVVPQATYIDGNTAIVVLDGTWTSRLTGQKTQVVVNIFTMREGRVAKY